MRIVEDCLSDLDVTRARFAQRRQAMLEQRIDVSAWLIEQVQEALER